MNDLQAIPQSALGRPLDRRFRSNVIVATVSVAIGLASGLYNLLASSPLPFSALTAAISVFLSWAIAREIDPDHAATAYVATALSAFFLFIAVPSLWAAFGILLATRLATGTVGIALGWIEGVVLVGLGAYLGASATTAVVVPALVIGISISGRRSRFELGVAAATALAAATSLAVFRRGIADGAVDGTAVVILVLVVGSLAVMLPTDEVRSTTDIGELPIYEWRLDVSRLLIGATFLIALASDVSLIYATGGAAIIAVAAGRVLRLVRSNQHLIVAD